MTRYLVRIIISVLLLVIAACATTTVEEIQPVEPEYKMLPYSGPRITIAVLPLGLSERAAKAYPHLLSKDVGMGVHNMVVEALFDSKRFTFVEEKPEIIKDALDRQWMSSSGMVDQKTAVEMGKILGAKKVIYGEVYDFAQGGEVIPGFSAKKNLSTRMGIQVRMVDVETLEYIPGSGVGRG
ncbi:MAG: CsgG/HfaB family protein, partial [Desulfuromonadaceae bacterium]|nr:CsgG/HfaB family protein [Desulfuromonadaceae bacterium]